MYSAIEEKIVLLAKTNQAVELARLLSEANQHQILPHLNVNDALSWAAHNGNTEVVQCLLHYGAEINCQDSQGNTPLHWAGYNGHTTTFGTLLQGGADATIKNHNQIDPLTFTKLHKSIDPQSQLLIETMTREITQLRNRVAELEAQLAAKSYATHGFFAQHTASTVRANDNASSHKAFQSGNH